MPTTDPNMGFLDPVASTGVSGTGDPGPGYATNITNALTTIGAHDHSSGKGIQITPAGINVNADLTFGSFNATSLRAARFTSQASALNLAGDLSEVYVKSGDLWYVNGSGVQVQVTAGSSLGTGPAGATGPAGTSFVSNYFQAGITGITGLSSFNTLNPTLQSVPWTRPDVSAGNIAQATAIGTGAAFVTVSAAGLYDVSYRLGITGIQVNQVYAYQSINATGLAAGSLSIQGGTLIPASVSWVYGDNNPNAGASPTATSVQLTARYVVQLGAGAVLGTWVGSPSGAGASVSPTGALFTVAKVG